MPDPLSLLAERSPGERDPGALFDTKQWLFSGKDFKPPWEKVLGGVRHRPEVPVVDLADLPPMTRPLGFDEPLGDTLPSLDSPPTLDRGIFPTIAPPSLSGPPGGPPGGGPPGAPPCCGTDATGPAVPEPSTWLMFLIGMMATGSAMRRGKPSAALPVSVRAR